MQHPLRLTASLIPLTLLAMGCGSGAGSPRAQPLPDAGAAADRCALGEMLVVCSSGGAESIGLVSATKPIDDGCESRCASDEFAASCGGMPRSLPDGGEYAPSGDPPFDSCRNALELPSGGAYYCCPYPADDASASQGQ